MAARSRICLVPKVAGVGGMVSFRARLEAGLAARGVQVCHDLGDAPYGAVLVIGGTRQIGGLWRARRRGARIVQRLDGMNWLHRARRGSGLRHFLRSEYGNFILAFIRSRLADHIVYQSYFSRLWWERVRGPLSSPDSVVYNGVDLSTYTPEGPQARPPDRCRLLLVEGALMGGYELGLEAGVGLAEGLSRRLKAGARPQWAQGVELMVVGRAAESLRNAWDRRAGVPVVWAGQVPRERIPEIDRSAHLLYSADIHPACPNSVIEALSCGLPVAAFNTGALPELVTGDAGRIAPYGGNAWRLEKPDVPALVEAALEIVSDPERFRLGARQRAEAAFGLDQMVTEYLKVLLG